MIVGPGDTCAPMSIAHEVSTNGLESALRYPSGTGGWLFGDPDLSVYANQWELAQFRRARWIALSDNWRSSEPLPGQPC
jgi:hypothetical protein